MNNIQNVQSGQGELKDYYNPYNSIFEAIKRRRKKRMESQGIELEDNTDFDQVPNPDI